MLTKIIFAFVCLVCTSHIAEGRTVSLYDLVPATPIKSELSHVGGGVGDAIFHNCSKSTDKFQLTNVLVAGCSTPPCDLVKGTNISIEIDFIAHEVTANMTAKVYGQIARVMVPFPLTNENACLNCGVQCPTKDGTSYKYKYSLPVSTLYPDLTLAVFWYLYDASNNEALCMDVAVTIKEPPNKIGKFSFH